MAIDLTQFVHKVWAASMLEDKKAAMLELVEASHACKETKNRSRYDLRYKPLSKQQLDKWASSYMMVGEGMKVR